MSLSNPLNVILLAPIAWLIYRLIFPSFPSTSEPLPSTYDPDVYNWMPEKHPEVLRHRKYTAKELVALDGRSGDRICLAIYRVGSSGKISQGGKGERTVFDVTSGRTFYGPDGVYGNFAGRDASRGMAKQSFEEDMLTPIDQPLDTLSDLTQSEIDNMRGWHGHFERKYVVCGELV
ncbi:hypothetical protein BCR39DRAFT_452553, partial [Naematelia encephala]